MPNVTIPEWVPPVAAAETLNAQDELSTVQANVPGLNTTIPMNYGQFQIGGKLGPVKLNGTTWTVGYIIGIGEHEAIDGVLLNAAAPLAGTLVNTYTGSLSQGIDPLLAAADVTYLDDMIVTNELGSVGVAYVVIQYTDDIYPGFPSVLVYGRGRKVYNPVTDTTVYSENPALCLADLIRDPFCGFNEPVDNDFLTAAAAQNDATVITEPRRRLGISLISVRDTIAWVDVLRTYAGCWPIKRGDTWFLIPDRPRSIDAVLDADYFKADTVQVGIVDDAREPTMVKLIYTDTSQTVWREREACWPLTLPAGTPRRESLVRMPGIQRYSQALREARERYNKLRRTKTISFIGTDEHIARERGDVLQISHKMGLTNALFRLYDDAKQISPGRWQIDAVEYDPSDYTNTETADPGGDETQKYFGLLRAFDASVNTVFRQANTPSGAVLNDLWFETDTDLLYTYDGATWLLIGNAYSTVSQLTDDVGIQGAVLGLNLLDGDSNVIDEVQALNQYVATNNMGGELTGNPFMTMVDPVYDRPLGWYATYLNAVPTAISYADAQRTILRLQSATDDQIGMSGRAFKINPRARYRGFIRYRRVGNNATAGGMYIRVLEKTAAIQQGLNAIGWLTGEAQVDFSAAAPHTFGQTVKVLSASDVGSASAPGNNINGFWSDRNISAADTWYEAEFEYTPNENAEWASPLILNWTNNGLAAIDVDSFFLYAYGTTNQVYSQATQPTGGADGDLWYETDTNQYYQFVNGSWQVAANAYDDTGQLVDGAQLGQTAFWDQVSGSNLPADNATQNQVYRQAGTPSGPSVIDGALWYETDTQLWFQRISGVWELAANLADNTSQLTDGANLGGTADWSGVTGAGTPEDNATANNGALADLDDIGGIDNVLTTGGSIRAGKTAFGGAQAGFWMGIDGGVAKFVFGNAAGTKQIQWDGNNLRIDGGLIVGPRVSLVDLSAQVTSANSPATTTIAIKNDRKVSVTNNVGSTPTGDIHQWLQNIGATSDYQVRVTGTGDTPTGNSLNTWLVLSSNRSWSLQSTYSPTVNKLFTGLIEIREISTSTILASADFVLGATSITV